MLRAFKRIPVSSIILPATQDFNTLFPDLVQQGISEKVAMVINFFAAFVTGFVLAYATSWRLALAMSAMLPCIGITGAFMTKFLSGYKQYVYHLCPPATSLKSAS